jgi:hypothetical protein
MVPLVRAIEKQKWEMDCALWKGFMKYMGLELIFEG